VCGARGLAGRLDGGQQERDQNADDRYHYQKLDQGERFAGHVTALHKTNSFSADSRTSRAQRATEAMCDWLEQAPDAAKPWNNGMWRRTQCACFKDYSVKMIDMRLSSP
jgi:hypothetical protein